MRIGLLQFKPGATIRSRKLPSDIKMLRDEVRNLGHVSKIIRQDKCQIYFTRKNPKVLYAGKPFPKVDVVIPRVTALNNVALHATILQQLEMFKVPMLQSYKSVIRSKNKLRTLQLLTKENIPVPRTIVVQRFEYLDTAIKKVGGFPIIIKTPFGSFGKGVAIVESRRALHSAFDMLLTSPVFSSLLIQEYVEESEGKDLRVFILNGEVLASMERTANKGDFRSNLALGGAGKTAKLTRQEVQIALDAAKALKLHFAGVDLLRSKHGPVVMEVNCNPGLEGITEITGVNVAREIVKFAADFADRQ
jgi:ribosomal protein S6--L-glutamate ligase